MGETVVSPLACQGVAPFPVVAELPYTSIQIRASSRPAAGLASISSRLTLLETPHYFSSGARSSLHKQTALGAGWPIIQLLLESHSH
jgi:hypothetical protein